MERQLKFNDLRKDWPNYLEQIAENRHPLYLILDQISDVRNLGAIFRLADAGRIAHLYILPDSSTIKEKKLTKVARNAEQYVPWSTLSSLEELENLKQKMELVALEITNQSIAYHQFEIKRPIGLVVGNEQRGIRPEVLQICDRSTHVPMMGRNTSMNAAMATGIAAFGLLEKMGVLDN